MPRQEMSCHSSRRLQISVLATVIVAVFACILIGVLVNEQNNKEKADLSAQIDSLRQNLNEHTQEYPRHDDPPEEHNVSTENMAPGSPSRNPSLRPSSSPSMSPFPSASPSESPSTSPIPSVSNSESEHARCLTDTAPTVAELGFSLSRCWSPCLPSSSMGFLRLHTPGISFSCSLGSRNVAGTFSSCACQRYFVETLTVVGSSIDLYRWFLHQFVYRPITDERLPPQVVFSCLRSGRAARSYCSCHYCLWTCCHRSWWVCILQSTLMDSMPIACRFTRGLGWLCGQFLFLTLRPGLVWFPLPTYGWACLISRTQDSVEIILNCFVGSVHPRTLLGARHQFLIRSLCFLVVHLRHYLTSSPLRKYMRPVALSKTECGCILRCRYYLNIIHFSDPKKLLLSLQHV